MNLYYSKCITDTVSAFALLNMAYYWHSLPQSFSLLGIASHYSSARGGRIMVEAMGNTYRHLCCEWDMNLQSCEFVTAPKFNCIAL